MFKMFRQLGRAWDRCFENYRLSPSGERLARFKAWQMRGRELPVVRVSDLGDGTFHIIAVDESSPGRSKRVIVPTKRRVAGDLKSVTLGFRRHPNQSLRLFLGREWATRPDSYLYAAF